MLHPPCPCLPILQPLPPPVACPVLSCLRSHAQPNRLPVHDASVNPSILPCCVQQESLRAKAFYVGDEVSETKRQSTRMAVDTKAPGQAPPDLPSLLLDGRICYIGMPVGNWAEWVGG
jgi:hypothetical protein